jgi:2-(1,2-epoxy-1,2-dihydrophenyl)acetyl-CoA isomerase
MSNQPILTHVENKVATLTFNRPDKLNTLNRELVTQSIACLKQWSRDTQIGAIVVTGSGRAFCAGGDVGNMAKDGPAPSLEEQIDSLREAQELSWLLYNIPKPTIAAVNGYVMGAGLGLCLACDMRTLMDREAETHLRCGQTQDHKVGARAFMEKRPPNFTGQ